jgi:hypothetical protein
MRRFNVSLEQMYVDSQRHKNNLEQNRYTNVKQNNNLVQVDTKKEVNKKNDDVLDKFREAIKEDKKFIEDDNLRSMWNKKEKYKTILNVNNDKRFDEFNFNDKLNKEIINSKDLVLLDEKEVENLKDKESLKKKVKKEIKTRDIQNNEREEKFSKEQKEKWERIFQHYKHDAHNDTEDVDTKEFEDLKIDGLKNLKQIQDMLREEKQKKDNIMNSIITSSVFNDMEFM